MPTVIFGLLGAVCASFIGLVVARLYTGASIVQGRSVCDACGTTLSPLALVPVLSWLISQGRCLACKARIGFASTAAEIILGVLFALAYLKFGLTFELLFALIALTLLTGLVLYDLGHAILPPILLWPFVLSTALFALASAVSADELALRACTALLLASSLALVHLASGGRAMGLADAPLAFGLALTLPPLLALSGLFYAFWIGGVVGTVLLARRALGATIKSEVPFAPYLAAGFLLALITQCDAFTLIDSLIQEVLR